MPGNLYLMLHCHSQHGEALSLAAFSSQTRSKITWGGARGNLYLMLHCHSQHSEALSVAAAGATLMVQYFEGKVTKVSTDHIFLRNRWIEFEGFAEIGPNLLCNMGYNTQLRLTRMLNFDFSDPYCPAPPALEEHRSLWPQARERAAVLRDRLPAGGVTCWISSPNFTTGQQSKHNNRSTFKTQLDW